MQEMTRPSSPDDAFAGASSGNGVAPSNYFNQPSIKRPHWGWNVITYLFAGGIMGGCGMLAAILDGRRSQSEARLLRNAKLASFALAAVCPMLLISHLGRPERFLHMMRIFKWKSPMSMGVWALVGFSGVAGATATATLARSGVLPRWLRIVDLPGMREAQGALGYFIAGYTGVLISATAVPIWAKGKFHIPAMCIASGIGGACALNTVLLAGGDNDEAIHKLGALELAASAAELGIILHFRQYAGEYGKPMFEGARGERFKALTLQAGLSVPLAIGTVLLVAKPRGPLGKILAISASLLTLFGGYIMRETLIESGKLSADDPKAGLAQPK